MPGFWRLIGLACLASMLAGCSQGPAVLNAGGGAAGEDVRPALPKIPDVNFNVKDFGATGDGKTWDTDAFKKAVAEINKQGGGHLIVPAGVYMIGPIELCSRLDLHVEEGAIIQAAATFTAGGFPEPETLKTQDEVKKKVKTPAPLISGKDLEDVAITGPGIIDGAGAHWWAWSERMARANPGRLIYPRAKLVVIHGCKRLHVDGITLRNSPKFHLAPSEVTDLLIEHVKIIAPPDAPNTDAIDPSACRNVLIRDCLLDVGDDDIAIKGSGLVEHVLIEDCQVRHGHGISIGSETDGGVRDMVVRRCTFSNADNGIRIKSMRGAGGLVENIRYSDIHMEKMGSAIVLDLLYVDNNRPNFRGDPKLVPKIKGVRIENVTVDGAQDAGKIVGLPDSPISDVVLKNVQIKAETDLILKNTDRISFENVSLTIHNGERKSTTSPATDSHVSSLRPRW